MESEKVVRQNISLDPKVFARFREITEKKGIKISTWVNQQMVQFIEDEEYLESRRKERLERDT